jgi:hypothetical protein
MNCELPWAILGCVERFAFVMLFDALIDVFGKANIVALRMRYGTNDVNVKHAVRRRSAEAELWRTAFARQKTERRFSTLLALGWRASRSSGVRRAKAGGEGIRTPVIPNLVHGLPHTS